MGIQVTMMGTPKVSVDGRELVFPYRKAEGLFYYLCVKGTVSRDEAIGIFWADCAENSARKNLRDAIYHLKKLLGEDVVSTEGNNRVRLNRDRLDSVDCEQLTDENILQRYTGDFLGYFYIKNCMEFEDWATDVREELKRRYRRALDRQVEAVASGGRAEPILVCADRLLRGRNTDEEPYRRLLGGLLELGALDEAEQLYQKLSGLLQEELGSEPEERTQELMEQLPLLRAGLRPGARREGEYFFGREREMMLLLANLDRFSRGERAQSVLLTGEAGVGKSAVMRRLQEVMGDERFLTISYQCVQTEQELYLKPWHDILTQVEELYRSLHLSFTPAPNFYSRQIDASLFATQYEMFAESALQTLSEQLTGGRKLVLFLDDVQWMDNASKRLLSNLMFWSGNRKLLMVLASRDGGAGQLTDLKAPLESRGLLTQVPLARFTRQETEEIIRERKPELLDRPDSVDRIYRDTDGNALFLLEFLKELDHGATPGQLSDRTRSMIQSRLVDLSAEERDLLDSISLYPRLATIEDLQILSSQSSIQMLRSLEHLLDRQLICLQSTYNKTGYGFTHQMIRDYIYNSMLEDKRQLLHRMVAQDYERQYQRTQDVGLCPMLIYHFDRCRNVYKCYTYRLEYLRAFYAVQHEIYPTVLTAQDRDENRLPRLGAKDELVNLAQQIRALNRDSDEMDPLRMKMEFLIGRYDLYSGEYDRGLKNIRTSIQLAEKLDDRKYQMENRLQLVFHAIQIHDLKMFNENLTVCERLLEKYAYPAADVCTVLRLRGLYHMKNYQYERAEEIFGEVIRRIEPLCQADPAYRIGLAACYNYIGESRQAKNQWDEALEYYRRAIDCCDGQVVSGMGVFCANAGYVLYRQGKLGQAQMYIDQAIRCFEEVGAMWGRSRTRSYAALLAIARGNWEEAEQHYQVARDTAQRGGNPSALLLVREVEQKLETHRRQAGHAGDGKRKTPPSAVKN